MDLTADSEGGGGMDLPSLSDTNSSSRSVKVIFSRPGYNMLPFSYPVFLSCLSGYKVIQAHCEKPKIFRNSWNSKMAAANLLLWTFAFLSSSYPQPNIWSGSICGFYGYIL